MKNIVKNTFYFLLLSSIFSVSAMDEASFKKEASSRAMTFMKSLKKELMSGVKKGFAEGVGHCKVEAPLVTSKSNQGEWRLGRTSHKVRNQKNTPQKWMLSYLDEYRKSKKKEPTVVKMADQHYVFLKPLYMGGMCLNCHGTKIPKAVQTKLDKEYPEDQAHGFKAGDFRGFVWVEYKK